MAGSGRRFALEAAFLVALAVAAALAGLSTAQIIGAMALGWVLTALVELVSWRLALRAPAAALAVPPVADEPAAEAVDEASAAEPAAEVIEEAPPTEPEEAAVEAPSDAPAEVAAEVEAEPEPAVEEEEPEPVPEAPEETHPARPRLEPLQPRPRRRGFWRRRRDAEVEVEVIPLERPSSGHVRLIGPAAEESNDAVRSAEER